MHSRGESPSGLDSGVEATLLRVALGSRALDRVLEMGCGSGRLIPALETLETVGVGIDVNVQALLGAKSWAGTRPGLSLARAEANHLPFRDASFSAVVMVRTYHRLSDPSGALREAARVLGPGGSLVVAVNTKPSSALLLRDVWLGLRQPGRYPFVTFSTGSRIGLASGENPGFVETLRLPRSRLVESGFEVARELGCGYEELPMLKNLPPTLWTRFGESLHVSRIFPSVFLVAVRRATGSARDSDGTRP